MWTDPGTIQIAHRHMNVEVGAEAALFPEKEYINGIFVTVYHKYLIRSKRLNLLYLANPVANLLKKYRMRDYYFKSLYLLTEYFPAYLHTVISIRKSCL
jgi:hypothetical protein